MASNNSPINKDRTSAKTPRNNVDLRRQKRKQRNMNRTNLPRQIITNDDPLINFFFNGSPST
ncbi:16162_t:CDS:2 [Rhizophagus irregularis]|nr:16162_t:CDS:2 [Rhizophagus irregularis]